MNEEKIGKFLSLILRHKPETIGIKLDENGWADVEALLAGMNRKGTTIDQVLLEEIVANNNKKRYSLSPDKKRIRANQGHSIDVDIELKAVTPPAVLYHGSADRFYESILRLGLQKQNRNHVHLSPDIETALAVGKRHGRPVVFTIQAKAMHDDGYLFYLSENSVWLTDSVPVAYLKTLEK